MSDDKVLVCTPCVENPTPVPGSDVRWCSICADEIWISPQGQALQERTPGMTLTCFDCAVGLSDSIELQVLPVPSDADTDGALNMRPALREFKRRVEERRRAKP